MHESLQDPWTLVGNRLVYGWIDDAQKDFVIEGSTAIDPQALVDIIDHAELLGTLGDMSREEAVILLSLWVGRANGAANG